MPVAESPRSHPGREVARRLVGERGEQARQQAHLDVLPAAARRPLQKRGENAHDGVFRGEEVDDRDPDLARLAAGVARDAHEPADGLHEEVITGQRRALAR